MRVVPVKQISLMMENAEEICFNIEHVVEFELEQTPKNYVKLEGQEVLEFYGVSRASFKISAAANHTYNSFGRASEINSFNRILDRADIAGLFLRTEANETSFYVSDTAEIEAEIDEVGDLYILITDSGCDEECCCEECI